MSYSDQIKISLDIFKRLVIYCIYVCTLMLGKIEGRR